MNAQSPVRRLAAAHWGLLVVCAGFLLAGVLLLDDYGVWGDGLNQRLIGQAALDYLTGGGDQALEQVGVYHDRYYGAAFEAPLVLVERLLGLENSRDIWLSRHMLTHLFFLAGGVFCYLLVQRMFGNRLLALIAMVLFVLYGAGRRGRVLPPPLSRCPRGSASGQQAVRFRGSRVLPLAARKDARRALRGRREVTRLPHRQHRHGTVRRDGLALG